MVHLARDPNSSGSFCFSIKEGQYMLRCQFVFIFFASFVVLCVSVWICGRIGCELFVIFDDRQSIHSCVWFSVPRASGSFHFTPKSKRLFVCVPFFSKWGVVGKRGSPTEESHLYLPDAGQIWSCPRPHGGGAWRATLRDHAMFCSYPTQGHDRGGRR